MARKKPNPTDVHVGARLRMRRMMLNISQEKLGADLGITFQQVQKYEKGSNRISASRLHHLCQVLQVDVAFFFDGAPTTFETNASPPIAPAPTYVAEFLSTRDGLSLTKAFMSISKPDVRRHIVELVECLADAR